MNIDRNSVTTSSTNSSSGTSGTAMVCLDGLLNTKDDKDTGIFDNSTCIALFTILVLVIIVLGAGGRIFGGYGDYPDYGGISKYGYTVPRWKKKYKYNPYDYYDEEYDIYKARW